jgi:hypothetical protein
MSRLAARRAAARFTSPLSALALVALTPLAGCTPWKLAEPARAPLDPMGAPPPGLAQVCVARSSAVASAVTFPVRDNGVVVGATRGPGHFCYLSDPGRHVIHIEADEVETASLDAAPGGRYYLLQEVENILGYVRCSAVWVDESVAREAIASTSYTVLVGVPGEERLPGPVPRAPRAQP